mgnify:CR=1 FL=1
MATIAHDYYSVDVSAPRPPTSQIQFRLWRDGQVTTGQKFLRVYRGVLELSKLEAVFWAEPGSGEYTNIERFDLALLLAQGDWLVLGVDDSAPRRVRGANLALGEPGVYTFNITSPVDKPEGLGYLAGEFPESITTRLDTPVSATIKVLHTAADGRMGKVAEVVSNPDGTWAVHGLDPTKQFDVICSLEGFNDLVLSKVSPTPY